MKGFLIKLPEDVITKMREQKEINWSSVARVSILKELEGQSRKSIIEEIKNLLDKLV